MTPPAEFTLELAPASRCDAIDVAARLRREIGDTLRAYKQAIYCSHHTTAGFLDRRLGRRLANREDLFDFIGAFQKLFPEEGGYEHDKLDKRIELSEEQRKVEPRNADSHLTFMSSGLSNCVTCDAQEDGPVYLIDLDGVWEHGRRRRKTSVIAYREEVTEARLDLEIGAGDHALESINLFDPALGVTEQLDDFVRRHGVGKGRLDLSLAEDESGASVTVNEYETLLMQHDLREVLRNPLRFMREKGLNMLRDPRAVPGKTLTYAQSDLVHLLNEIMDAVGATESLLERLVARLVALPASRLLGVKREVSLVVSESENGASPIVRGTYQSPILVQWRRPDGGRRRLTASLVSFH